MKLGRNDLCWCGSGLKFKKCHLERAQETPLSRGEIENFRRKNNSKKTCSVSGLFNDKCDKKIVNAHTISKSGSLKQISDDGHVMGAKPSLDALIKNEGKLTITKVGVGQASAFTGFCANHDKSVFSPIENKEITHTNEQLFLLAYRGMCREKYTKETQAGTTELLKQADRGQAIGFQIYVQQMALAQSFGLDLGLRDLRKLKTRMDEILLSKNFDQLCHCVLHLKSTPKILVSSMVAPDIDFHGRKIQELGDPQHNYEYIFLTA